MLSFAINGGSGGDTGFPVSSTSYGLGIQPTSASGGYGNRGGDLREPSSSGFNRGTGGGGGAGTRGLEGTSVVGGAGGNGLAGVGSIDFKTYFNLPTNNTIGQYISQEDKVYFSGGGGGGECVDGTPTPSIHGLGGKGGGANGNTTTNIVGVALANSGGGGGGGGFSTPTGSNGGSGVVIIRYRRIPTTSSSIDLIRGTSGDANTDFSITNNNGDFKIISSVSGTTSTRLTINSAGNVGLGVASVSTGFSLEVAQGTGVTSSTQSIDFRYFSLATPLTL